MSAGNYYPTFFHSTFHSRPTLINSFAPIVLPNQLALLHPYPHPSKFSLRTNDESFRVGFAAGVGGLNPPTSDFDPTNSP